MRRPPRPPRVYAIADADALGALPIAEAVAAMAEAGVGWIQVRAKRLPGERFYEAVGAACRVAAQRGAELWVNDRADLAALLPVAGVHLGQTDLEPRLARRAVGDELWIGLSTHDEEQLAAAAGDPDVDVVAVGPVFATSGKRDPDPVVGLELVRRARRLTRKPVVAIGGIDASNIQAVLAAGADAAAVLGAVCRGDVAANSRRLLAAAAEAPEVTR